jgi:general stress protein 26
MTEPEAAKTQHLRKILEGFATGMLVTHDRNGRMHSRPMAIAETRGDGGIYFATAIDSGKVAEIAADPRVNVALQSTSRFASLTGTARVLQDRALIESLWSESWKVWFPEGKSDPSLRVVAVDVEEAEYWDTSAFRGLKYLFEAAKAYVTGTRPDDDPLADHGKIDVR